MPRKKQQNPQPVKLDSEDGVTLDAPANLTLETDFLLGQDLSFGDSDHDKILGLDKFSEVAAEIGFSVYPLGEDQSPAYSQLSMESEADDSRNAADNGRGGEEEGEDEEEERGEDEGGRAGAQTEPTFPPYLSCRGCGQLRDDPLGPGMDLVGPYCLRCCSKASKEAHKSMDFCSPFGGGGGGGGGMRGSGSSSQMDSDDGGEKLLGDEDGFNKLHTCHVCGFSSRYANHVKRHMKTHNGEKPYNCPLCTYASAQLVNLQRHLRIHTGEKPYKCDRCTFACSSLGNLKRHQRMHTTTTSGGGAGGLEGANRPVVIGHVVPQKRHHVTGRRPNEDELLHAASTKEVMKQTAPNLNVDAQNSDYNLSPFENLKGGPPPPPPNSTPASGHHLHHHHPRPLLEGPGGGAVGGGMRAADSALPPSLFPFTCRLCGVVLEDEDGSSAQICAKCTLDMLTKDSSSSSPNSPGERSDKVYTCAACPFLTHYPNHLARHMKTHSGEKPYKCPQCDYASAHFDNLKRHHRVHTGEKPYKCHLCDYACGNLANLKRHQRVHSGAKPFQCTVCNYSCNQSMNLKRHMLRHTGEKPYKCVECGYTTGHWDNYKRHQKKHGLATEGWVKVPLPRNNNNNNNADDDDEEDDDVDEGIRAAVGGGGGVQTNPRKDVVGGVDNMQYIGPLCLSLLPKPSSTHSSSSHPGLTAATVYSMAPPPKSSTNYNNNTCKTPLPACSPVHAPETTLQHPSSTTYTGFPSNKEFTTKSC